MMKRMKKEVKRDRISELPEEIKEKILSSLCMKDAICTSSLSSVWRYSWVSLPFLDFGYQVFSRFASFFGALPTTHPKKRRLYSIFHDNEEKGDSDSDDENTDCITKHARQINRVGYLQILDEFFQLHTKKNPSLGLKKMSLYVPRLSNPKMRDYGADIVSRCLSLAKHNVTELHYWVEYFEERYCPKDSYSAFQYCFPILELKTLTKLELRGCYSVTKKTVDVLIDLPNLRHLSMMGFIVDESMLETLLTKCQALEKIDFLNLKGFKVLRVPRFSKLKELQVKHIHDLDLVEINAMSLQCLTLINYYMPNKWRVKMTSNSCNNLVKLFATGCDITDDFFNKVEEFPNLETVSLTDCTKLEHIKITAYSLTRLDIIDCPNLSQVDVDTLNLFFTGYSSSGKNIIKRLFPKS